MASCMTGRLRDKDKRNKLEGKKTKESTPTSAATSKTSVPKKSTTRAASRPPVALCFSPSRIRRTAGSEPWMAKDAATVELETADSGRSTGGRATAETPGVGESTKVLQKGDEESAAETMKVTETPWRRARRRASSASGVMWPMPGLGSMATCMQPPWSLPASIVSAGALKQESCVEEIVITPQ